MDAEVENKDNEVTYNDDSSDSECCAHCEGTDEDVIDMLNRHQREVFEKLKEMEESQLAMSKDIMELMENHQKEIVNKMNGEKTAPAPVAASTSQKPKEDACANQ